MGREKEIPVSLVPIIFSWVSHSWQGASERRKIPQKGAFSSPTKRRGWTSERVRVARRIHDEAITTFFVGEVMCYWGATRCNLCLHQGSRVHIVPGAPMKCPDNNGPTLCARCSIDVERNSVTSATWKQSLSVSLPLSSYFPYPVSFIVVFLFPPYTPSLSILARVSGFLLNLK